MLLPCCSPLPASGSQPESCPCLLVLPASAAAASTTCTPWREASRTTCVRRGWTTGTAPCLCLTAAWPSAPVSAASQQHTSPAAAAAAPLLHGPPLQGMQRQTRLCRSVFCQTHLPLICFKNTDSSTAPRLAALLQTSTARRSWRRRPPARPAAPPRCCPT